MFIDFLQLTGLFGLGIILTSLLSFIFAKNKKSIVIITMIELIVLGGFIYFALPDKTLSGLLTINLLGAMINSALLLGMKGLDSAKNVLLNKKTGQKIKTITEKNWPGRLLVLSILGFGLLLLISFVTSLTSIDEVYNTIPTKIEEKSEPLSSTKETPIALAPDTAKRKMLQQFSVIKNSNMFSLDGITAQTVNGEYVYVATVEFNGFFKWLKLKEVPGYFIISATDNNAQPKFVEKPITYSPNAYFSKDAARRIYAAFPSYASSGTINLEIDEDGNPFYVQTLYKEYGVSGKMHYDEFKTAVLNGTTGEVKLYDAKDAPEFVDAPITSSAVDSMNTFYGRYGEGWWNQSLFGAKKNVKLPTENGVYASGRITPLLSTEGQLFYFTDFTSEDTQQDSALGYSLVNARSGELTYYRDEGLGLMDSDGAISIAEKIYPEKKWEAEMPILYNVDGTPTWIISLLDSKGLFKKYVYVNAVDNDIVVDGDDAQSTLDSYRVDLLAKGSNNQNTEVGELEEISGVVKRVQILNSGENTLVNFLLADQEGIFSVNISDYPYALFLETGDNVTFKAANSNQPMTLVQELTIKSLE